MEKLHHLLQLFSVILCPSFSHCTDQNILRRMLHIDKFQNLRPISVVFKNLSADCIGIESRHTFLDQSVLQCRLQDFIVNLARGLEAY